MARRLLSRVSILTMSSLLLCSAAASLPAPAGTGTGNPPSDEVARVRVDLGDIAWEGITTRRIAKAGIQPRWLSDGRTLLVRGARSLADTFEERSDPDGSWSRRIDLVAVWLISTEGSRDPVRLVEHACYAQPCALEGTAAVVIQSAREPERLEALCLGFDCKRLRRQVVLIEHLILDAAADPQCAHIAFEHNDRMRVVPWTGAEVHVRDAAEVGLADRDSQPCWSRDGKRLAWAYGNAVYTYSTGSRKTRRISTDPYRLSQFTHPGCWSADGRSIVGVPYEGTREENGILRPGTAVGIASLDTVSGKLQIIRRYGEWEDCGDATWSRKARGSPSPMSPSGSGSSTQQPAKSTT